MHARVTAFKANDISAVEAQLGALSEKAAKFPGLIRNQVVWSEDGSGLVVAIYESKEAAMQAAEHAQALWGGLMPLMEEPPHATEFPKAHIMK